MREFNRFRVDRRDDHPHADPRPLKQVLRKVEGHSHAAVRGRIARQRPTVQRQPVPGDALHVRHPGIVIHGRVMVLVLLDDGKDPGGRLASGRAGRDRRAQDPAVGVVECDLLTPDRHDRHDRLAGGARRLLLVDLRGTRLLGRGVRDRRCQRGHRREHHSSGRSPPPQRHGGLRRLKSTCHALPRLKCPSAPCVNQLCVDQVSKPLLLARLPATAGDIASSSLAIGGTFRKATL